VPVRLPPGEAAAMPNTKRTQLFGFAAVSSYTPERAAV
jgi:hypothetical protein